MADPTGRRTDAATRASSPVTVGAWHGRDGSRAAMRLKSEVARGGVTVRVGGGAAGVPGGRGHAHP
ncbi:hypothetical protein ACSNOI_24630 [Actinomadura kijaniata]|uniref:hypothetical protein n=1 Tax=Actinomadura kijaniata TaxID=46161 RepID=UPI003F1BCB6D